MCVGNVGREQLASHSNLVSFCERVTAKYFAAHVPAAGELPPLPEVVGGPKPAEKEDDGAHPPKLSFAFVARLFAASEMFFVVVVRAS